MCFRLEGALSNRGHMDEFKSNVTRLVNISKIVDQPVNIAVALLRSRAGKFGGKIWRENWWPSVLKVRFCNFDYCFHSKRKMEPTMKRLAHLTDQR